LVVIVNIFSYSFLLYWCPS